MLVFIILSFARIPYPCQSVAVRGVALALEALASKTEIPSLSRCVGVYVVSINNHEEVTEYGMN